MAQQIHNPFAASDALFAEDYRSLSNAIETVEDRGPITLSASRLPNYQYAYQTGDK